MTESKILAEIIIHNQIIDRVFECADEGMILALRTITNLLKNGQDFDIKKHDIFGLAIKIFDKNKRIWTR